VNITCPACRKHNPDASNCQRCGADLLPLVHIHQAARRALEEGRQYLKQRRSGDALSAAKQSWRLKHSAEAAGLAFLACLHQQQFDAATQWYQRAQYAKTENASPPNIYGG
jgi:hypothetical protein